MTDQTPVVGARETCPCGSGRRYKACHGRAGHERSSSIVTRPFEGLAGECDWVALREFVPAATAPLFVKSAHGSVITKATSTKAGGGKASQVTAATVLPLAWPAMVRTDGSIYLGVQSSTHASDASRDLAAALLTALDAEAGTPVEPAAVAAAAPDGPRLQDIVEPRPLEVNVHDGFQFWGDDMPDPDGELAASLERASAAVVPTARLTSVEAAYWCRIGSRTHLRWVLPDPEEPLLDGLAKLHAARELALVEGSKYVGAFRALGLVVPVWDLPADAEAADVDEPAAALRKRLDEALADRTPLTPSERRSRAGLLSRQVTLR